MATLRHVLLASLLALGAVASPRPVQGLTSHTAARSVADDHASLATLQTREEEKKKKKPKTPKYFHEPGGSLARAHYDARYFKDEVPYDEHRVVLRDLARSYLTVFAERGAETWLSHGTLLGWWWNGQIMPWDYDLDMQISYTTMQWLGDNLNRTEHAYNATDDSTGEVREKRYLLDVNPHHAEITRGDGMNIIDARWIDMENGMFIDITGLREREQDRPGEWSCKNKHRYRTQDLWPMYVSTFEGVKAKIPYSFQKILSDEYGDKSLVAEEWEGHRWDRDIKEWVKMSEEEEAARRRIAQERKKQDLEAQGRL
ncbi:uncharacterized protein J7T54_007340 [Emericellopsis cladophorae]|uniref:LicD/FKTN/FKRP nucleotidyltransferase domain-containing protein n=1 Tax=Emericellopsis cladophorae TaxID=2686198 RepID=A0A9Q0BDS5_9HYPO|nr:uncharacterized protein J7T54_007340 [Emericellopsis cladophorae]KAI6780860.1 hypothetical protein J7T54_007340 [Emericellopsis cladophorae]